jgi:hypothetical protein
VLCFVCVLLLGFLCWIEGLAVWDVAVDRLWTLLAFGVWGEPGGGIVELMMMQSRKYISRRQTRDILMNVIYPFK